MSVKKLSAKISIYLTSNLPSSQRNPSSGFLKWKFFIGYFEIKSVFKWFSKVWIIDSQIITAHRDDKKCYAMTVMSPTRFILQKERGECNIGMQGPNHIRS